LSREQRYSIRKIPKSLSGEKTRGKREIEFLEWLISCFVSLVGADLGLFVKKIVLKACRMGFKIVAYEADTIAFVQISVLGSLSWGSP
jgi:hypothetical protein